MPNPIAWLVLTLIIPFSFYAVRRWKPLKAAMIVIVGSAMFAPSHTGFDLPVLPSLSKEVLPQLMMLIAFLALRRQALKARMFRGPEILVLAAMFGTFMTALTNGDAITHGPRVLPGQTPYDGFVDAVEILVAWLPAFYLGRALVRTSQDLRYLVRFFVLAGLIYCIPILIELRMSPQMHNWVYGFHQTDFIQTMRYGGYRPKVFMRHGLNVALFMTITCLLAVIMYRSKLRLRKWWTPGRAALFLFVIVIFCKSTGAYFHLALVLPMVLFANGRWQTRLAMGLVVIVLGYPVLRANDLVPVQAITDWMSENVNRERAISLWFRLYTEGEILLRTRERLWFGWGGYGRPYIFDEVTGEQVSVLDGYWAIELGNRGLWGFFCVFGMVCWPVVTAVRKLRQIESPVDRRIVAGVALLSILYVFDWLPNSSVAPELTFMVGALAGAVPGILEEQRRAKRRRRRERTAAVREGRRSRPPPAASETEPMARAGPPAEPADG